jgi:hypothetical protein
MDKKYIRKVEVITLKSGTKTGSSWGLTLKIFKGIKPGINRVKTNAVNKAILTEKNETKTKMNNRMGNAFFFSISAMPIRHMP